jgi:hypothetical protein
MEVELKEDLLALVVESNKDFTRQQSKIIAANSVHTSSISEFEPAVQTAVHTSKGSEGADTPGRMSAASSRPGLGPRASIALIPRRNDDDFMNGLQELDSLKHELRIMKSVYNSRFDNDLGSTRALSAYLDEFVSQLCNDDIESITDKHLKNRFLTCTRMYK